MAIQVPQMLKFKISVRNVYGGLASTKKITISKGAIFFVKALALLYGLLLTSYISIAHLHIEGDSLIMISTTKRVCHNWRIMCTCYNMHGVLWINWIIMFAPMFTKKSICLDII